jgi:hypothetical protein
MRTGSYRDVRGGRRCAFDEKPPGNGRLPAAGASHEESRSARRYRDSALFAPVLQRPRLHAGVIGVMSCSPAPFV